MSGIPFRVDPVRVHYKCRNCGLMFSETHKHNPFGYLSPIDQHRSFNGLTAYHNCAENIYAIADLQYYEFLPSAEKDE